MVEVVHAVLHNMTGASSECAFACEKVKFKREFVLSIVSPLLSKHGCMFEDMTTLPSGVSTCAAHRQACKVTRRTDIHVCGFFCKDLSKLNGQRGREERSQILRSGLGSSGKTFAAVMNSPTRRSPV